jgi:hypothetical protein
MRQRVALVVVVLIAALAITWVLGLAIGSDFHTYDAAAAAFRSSGNPYAANVGRFFEAHYRYPPLLAIVWPVVRWAWFPLCSLAWGLAFWLRWRRHGGWGLLLPVLLFGLWFQSLLVGNATALAVGALALVPRYRRAGAVASAVATWLKLFPVVVVLYYLGRRDWEALRWYAGTFLLLGIIQAPWIGSFVDYSSSPLSAYPSPGLSALRLGWLVFGVVALVATTSAYVTARSRYGWTIALVAMLAISPRLLVTTFALLLADPDLFVPTFTREPTATVASRDVIEIPDVTDVGTGLNQERPKAPAMGDPMGRPFDTSINH